MKRTITLADLIMAAGGLVAFLFSFLSFFDPPRGGGVNAWDGDVGAFATTTPALLGLVMVIWIGLELAGVSLPERVLTFDHAQLKATWGIGAAGIILSWLSADFGGADKGIGFWLMLVGSFAMAAGAVMALLGKGTETIDLPGGGDRSSPTPPATGSGDVPPPPPPSS